jgi:ABC-type transport system substrate-binding protein
LKPRLLLGRSLLGIVLLTVIFACASPSAPAAPSSQPAPVPKRITVAISGEPKTIYATFGAAGVRGAEALNALVNSGFSALDVTGTVVPHLVDANTSNENGQWKLHPDG